MDSSSLSPALRGQVIPHELDKDYKHLQVLLVPSEPQIVHVLLDRPQKRNAIHAGLWREIGSVFARLGRLGDDCRVVVLGGRGPSFCAGIDISSSSSALFPTGHDDVARTGVALLPQILDMQAAFSAIESCPVPIVAAIHGNCIGAGVDLACCADVRLATTEAIFSVREVQLGLAADVGTLQRLPKIVGNQSSVRELCLTGRNFSAVEALRLGFVSEVTDDLARTVAKLCSTISQHSPIAVHGTKKALLYARDHTVGDSLDQIATFNALALQSSDLEASVKAKLARSRANFPPIPMHSRL